MAGAAGWGTVGWAPVTFSSSSRKSTLTQCLMDGCPCHLPQQGSCGDPVPAAINSSEILRGEMFELHKIVLWLRGVGTVAQLQESGGAGVSTGHHESYPGELAACLCLCQAAKRVQISLLWQELGRNAQVENTVTTSPRKWSSGGEA